jgi:TolA-binding protein
MKFYHRIGGNQIHTAMLAFALVAGVASAQNYGTEGISDVVASADRLLQRGDYGAAIPALKEVIRRTESLTDLQGRDTCQTCRFQLARCYYRQGDIPAGMKLIETYLENEPRGKEKLALRMMAQGFFEKQEWGKIEEIANRILSLRDKEPEDVYNANLLLGQAMFRQEKWKECIKPLSYASTHADEERVASLCQIMVVRALVEDKNWRELFGWIPRIYRTDSKYDITLNLTLMKAGKSLYEDGDEDDLLNALLLYRMVLPREKMIKFAEKKVANLTRKLDEGKTAGSLLDSDIKERQTEIDDIRESMKTLSELPPYEDEVTFRIGQIYAEVKRYWEGYVLFDKLYRQDRKSQIGEASMLQSVLILYDVQEIQRAEERILLYLDERPDGQYARTLLSMMVRDNLIKGNFARVIELRPYLEGLPPTTDRDELDLQSDLHYMLAFGYFQIKDYKTAGLQFSVIVSDFPQSSHFHDSRYYRGMTSMLQADYANALDDFQTYQKDNEYGEYFGSAMFREGVCLFGLERIAEAEAVFTKFIEAYPDDQLVSEAYSMRGDIEAAKEASNKDPYTLDRSLADYRKGIDKAASDMQAAYPAFKAAEVYKLESKWQEIIDLMNYYMDRWEEKADVAEAVFWIGQSQIELGQVADAVSAYLSAIERFGDDPSKQGVDKIMLELVKVADFHLSEEDREGLALKVKLQLTNVDLRMEVLRLRLRITQAMLMGEEATQALGAELLDSKLELKLASPAALALMCDAAVATGNSGEMQRIADYFIENFEDSDSLWHAFRARTFNFLAEKNYKDALWTIDEAQGMFGAEPHMGWAQLTKADTEFKLGKFLVAFDSYNTCMSVGEWRGPIQAEAMFGMGNCKLALDKFEDAHSFYQRTYLLFKSYAGGDWAAKGYLAAADCLIKLGREADAVNTLKAMLEDEYVNTNPLAEQVREQLKKLGVQ